MIYINNDILCNNDINDIIIEDLENYSKSEKVSVNDFMAW